MRFLVSRNDKLGDFTLSLPVFYVLKKTYPNSFVAALVSPLAKELAEKSLYIDEVIVDDKLTILDLSKKLKNYNFDIGIALFSNFKIGLAFFLSGIKIRVAPATKIAQIFYNKKTRQKRSKVAMREFEYNLDLLKLLDSSIDLDFIRPLIAIDENQKTVARDEFYKNYNLDPNKKIVAFHVGSGGSSIGNLSIKSYVKLAKEVSRSNKYLPVFIFGPADFDKKNEVLLLVDYEAVFYDSKSGIFNFCALISNFSLFIATSTGTLQIAGALNLNTIGFFGDTLIASSKRWGTLADEFKQISITVKADEDLTNDAFLLAQNYLIGFLNGTK